MAAFGAKGIQGSILNVSSLYEYRGVSFAAGGDGNVSTVPNFIKRYNPRLLGASVGEHLVEYCEGLRDYPGVNFKEDWKLINVLIGTVDQCYSCISSYESSISPEVYGASIDNMLARIRKEVPRALVNLIGTYNNSQTKIIAANQKYCEPFASTDFEFNQLECWCIHYEPSRRIMDRFVTAYNEQLRKNSKKYNLYNDQDFAVMFSPSPRLVQATLIAFIQAPKDMNGLQG
ncbi:hypothetical protein DFQ30_001799 [Apophysomyces sp. BC1015]|nr:hypothetical protein DFQ30_001799 [Apophysomyces sp. BC1015]